MEKKKFRITKKHLILAGLLLLVVAALIYTRPMTIEQLCPGLDFSKCTKIYSHYYPTDIEVDVKIVPVYPGEPEFQKFIELFQEHKFRRSLRDFLPMDGEYRKVVDTDGSSWYTAFYFEDTEFPDGTLQSGRLLDCNNYGNQALTLGLRYEAIPAVVMGEHDWLREVFAVVKEAREKSDLTESKPKTESEPAIWVEEVVPEVPKPVDSWKPPEGSDVNLLKAMTETYLMQVSRIDLVLENEPIHVVEDAQAVEGIVSLMANAPIQGGYSPMPWHTCSGFGLKFVFDDGTELMVELGLDNDMCRIGNWIRTYGPENDYNAVTELLDMLGLDTWPQEVMDTYSEVFEQYPIVNGRHAWKPNYQFCYVPYEAYSEDKNFVTIQYPDGTKDGVGYGKACDILFHLRMVPYDLTDQKEIAKEDCEYVLIFDFEDGETRELLCMAEDRFYVQGDGIDLAWTFTSPDLAALVADAAKG